MDRESMRTRAGEVRDRYFGERNISEPEQYLSLAAGAGLTILGIRRGGGAGFAIAAAGIALLERGATGHCRLFDALGVSTDGGEFYAEEHSFDPDEAMHVDHIVTIGRSRDELYSAWRDFASLPQFMDHLESVEVLSNTRSRWTTKGPAGKRFEWEAEIIEDVPVQRITWETAGDADVDHQGRVEFRDAPPGRGTEVRVALAYDAPGGQLGRGIAYLMGRSPYQQVRTALHRFKQKMEIGHIVSSERRVKSEG